MEFFQTAQVKSSEEELQKKLTVANLDKWCATIEEVYEVHDDNSGRAYTIWGDFLIKRQLIVGGVRFSLPECPNMMAWTLTTGYDPAPEDIVVHCTIARKDQDEDFVESLYDFVDDWKAGLEKDF
ncbi:MAG TPA: hypothetical protein ENJ10_12015 [Caldithrix abyssi]|uniref:SRPBCC domain-containing protein n=1 Tax=Caldithrix abyssi TaxID=187145 RepID=A0A7V1LPQ3_CALAY|nr:hypothetical protein [Caldithrix abyssi]